MATTRMDSHKIYRCSRSHRQSSIYQPRLIADCSRHDLSDGGKSSKGRPPLVTCHAAAATVRKVGGPAPCSRCPQLFRPNHRPDRARVTDILHRERAVLHHSADLWTESPLAMAAGSDWLICGESGALGP
ncbi:hypothetical protein J6590_042484 [Homalodisca vitripennis]|nr:hypothetical protein J6590_042484 [Homalodisca vitripennis]